MIPEIPPTFDHVLSWKLQCTLHTVFNWYNDNKLSLSVNNNNKIIIINVLFQAHELALRKQSENKTQCQNSAK